jgi:hypothetical protein
MSASREHTLRIRRGGRDIEGRWRLEGGEVQVECPYGADHSPLNRSRPTVVAETLLARLAFLAFAQERARAA